MNDGTAKFNVSRISDGERGKAEVSVAQESPLTIILNDQELVTLLCSPVEPRYLAIGYLSSEGFIKNKDDIESVLVDDRNGIVRIHTKAEGTPATQLDQYKRMITSGCGRGVSFYSTSDMDTQIVDSQIEVFSQSIIRLVKEFQGGSLIYRKTHGVHSAALCDPERIIVFSEDIGRHNAVDKIFGRCILEDIPIADRMVITSGRISSEIVFKVAKRNIPILISISVPTDLGVRIAEKLGITLVSSARGRRMNISTNDWRIC